MARARILILGGTGEGFRLAERLHAADNIDVVTSMAGRTPAPKTPAGVLRRGGFGGPEGLAAFLREDRTDAVIDATHPFASGMSRNAALAAQMSRVPTVHIWRPGWSRGPGDDWREVARAEEAVDALPVGAGKTFLTTGKTQLHHFAARDDVAFLARVVSPLGPNDAVGPLPKDLTFVYDKGPFELDDERALLQRHRIQWIVSKNSGGEAAYAKLQAARELGIPVIMIQRPPPPDGCCVPDADAALDWLNSTLGLGLTEVAINKVMA